MVLVEWQAPEFEHRPKGISWYWMTILFAVFCVAAAMWQKNFLFGLFIVIGEILILVWGNREPAVVKFQLTERGLTVGNGTMYALPDLESFSVEDDAHLAWPNIVLRFKNRFRPAVRITVERARVGEITQHLGKIVPQAERDESLIDTLEKFFGF